MATLANYFQAFAADGDTVSSTKQALSDIGTAFTAAVIADADAVHISTYADAIRYRYDGGDPTAAVGHRIAANGEAIIVGRANVARLLMIRETTDATVFITASKMGA